MTIPHYYIKFIAFFGCLFLLSILFFVFNRGANDGVKTVQVKNEGALTETAQENSKNVTVEVKNEGALTETAQENSNNIVGKSEQDVSPVVVDEVVTINIETIKSEENDYLTDAEKEGLGIRKTVIVKALERDTNGRVLSFKIEKDPLFIDSDEDGLSDSEEENEFGTDKNNYDTDGDNASDGDEVMNGTNPLVNENLLDSDNDGLTDAQEMGKYKTDKNNADTDGDGYSDGDEINAGFNPLGEGKL
ncbi:hypothetical protein ISS03_00615 [Patescibacteria group bacterium]|nr:hypothetical protein [Patescibacteria group bacterium]